MSSSWRNTYNTGVRLQIRKQHRFFLEIRNILAKPESLPKSFSLLVCTSANPWKIPYVLLVEDCRSVCHICASSMKLSGLHFSKKKLFQNLLEYHFKLFWLLCLLTLLKYFVDYQTLNFRHNCLKRFAFDLTLFQVWHARYHRLTYFWRVDACWEQQPMSCGSHLHRSSFVLKL